MVKDVASLEETEADKTSGKWIYVSGAAVIILILGIIGFVVYKEKSSNEPEGLEEIGEYRGME